MPSMQLSNGSAGFWETLIYWDPEADNKRTLLAPNGKFPFSEMAKWKEVRDVYRECLLFLFPYAFLNMQFPIGKDFLAR